MGRTLENQYFGLEFSERSIEEIERAAHPNKDFTYGFLGTNERLTDIIEQDEITVERLGISYEAIASAI